MRYALFRAPKSQNPTRLSVCKLKCLVFIGDYAFSSVTDCLATIHILQSGFKNRFVILAKLIFYKIVQFIAGYYYNYAALMVYCNSR